MRRRAVLRAGAAGLGALTAGRAVGHPDHGGYAPLGRLPLEGATEAVADGGRTAYVAVTDGFVTVDLSDPAAPSLLAERRDLLADRGGPMRKVRDLSVDGDRLLVVAPTGPAPGSPAGALLLDVSDPAAPREVAFRRTGYPIHNCVLSDGVGYLTANALDGNPLVTLDAAAGLERLGQWSLFDHDDAWREVAPGLRQLHDLGVSGDVAALACWDAGVWLLDVSDPAAPSYLGHAAERGPASLADLEGSDRATASTVPPGNVHSVDAGDDGTVLAVGRETWAVEDGGEPVGGPSGVDLYDVSDPRRIERLARIDPPPTPDPTHGGVWTTVHNFELTGDTLYSAWYQGGVKRHDVADPAAPSEETWWRRPAAARFWTAQAGVDGEFFVASDMGVDGPEGALYAFPDRPGEQAEVPEPPLTPDPGSTPTPGSGSAPTVGTTAAARTPGSAAGSTPTAGPTGAAGASTPTAPASPGFGPAAALAGVGLAAWRYLRRDRS